MKLPKIPIKLIIFTGFIGAIIGLGVFVWIIKFTHSGTRFGKAYCMTCHSYQGRSEFWRDSVLHPASVTCDACHATHGELIPKDFSADQERMNQNCIRCHEDMLYNNDWQNLKTNVQKIKIQHGVHIEKAQSKCMDCHNNISHDSSPRPTNRPHMAKCFDCHNLEETSCDTCHDDLTEEMYPGLQVAEVSVRACSSCHIDFVQKSIQPKYPYFQHQKHLLMLMDCKTCHSTTEPHPKTVVSKVECLSCHHQELDTKACKDCHMRQFQLYHGEKFANIKGHQNPMAKVGLTCELGCHKDVSKGHNVESVKGWCVGCHGEQYGQMLDEWRASLGSYSNELHTLLTIAEQKVDAACGKDEICKKAKHQIDSAKSALDLVERGKGAHNFEYSQKILEDARKKLQNTIQDFAKHEGKLEPAM